MTIDDFYTNSESCVNLFNHFSISHALRSIAKADHLCYKCESKKSFEEMKKLFENNSFFVYQSIISNRRIAYIKLKKGVSTVLGVIDFLELSDQKPDGSQREGFDHIEVYPTAISYEELIKKLEKTEKITKVIRPHHTTHDINIGNDFLFRCTEEPLLAKIKREEII